MLSTNDTIEILRATVICLENQVASRCNKQTECDECELCFRQGTVGEQITAFKNAADILERLQKEVELYGKK